MSTQSIITISSPKNISEFNAVKEVQNYCRVFSEIKNCYNSIKDLETYNYELFSEYSNALKALLTGFMYSDKTYPLMVRDAKNNRVPKLDNDGKPIMIVNKQMVESLSESGFMSPETIQNDLWSHIMTKDLYFINNANDAKHSYNLIKISVNRKLCDLIKCMKRYEPITNAISLSSSTITDEGDQIILEMADPKADVEFSTILWDAKNNIIHQNIHNLIKDNKPHRMIAYIGNICNLSNGELLNLILENGYSYAIHQIISMLQDVDINIGYLDSIQLDFPKKSNEINLHHIETWKSEGLRQVREYMIKELSY